MKIGFDASRAFTKENTGTENYSLNLLKALAKVDRKNRYRVYLREGQSGRSKWKVGVNSLYTPDFDFRLPDNFHFKIIRPYRLWTQLGLALETWRSPVDLLFVPAHTLPVLRNYRVKTVVTIHDLGVEYLPGYHKFPQRYYLDLASKYAARNADRLIAVSRATKRDLVKRWGVESDKISVVYEGVDRRFFKPRTKNEVLRIKKKYNIAGDYFLCVGTVQPRKNLMFLIDIFNTLVKNYSVKASVSKYNKLDHGISLVVAGKMGWDWEPILARVKGLGWRDERGRFWKGVKFIGYVAGEDLPALYSGAKALISPSLFEGFGLPILEALSCGCRVIASDIPAYREIFHEITRGYQQTVDGKWQMVNTKYQTANGKYQIPNGKLEHQDAESGKKESQTPDTRFWPKSAESGKKQYPTAYREIFHEITRGYQQTVDGKWLMVDGKWQMVNTKYQTANGKSQMANLKWQISDDKLKRQDAESGKKESQTPDARFWPKSAEFGKVEAMALAKLNNPGQWLSLLYQYVYKLDRNDVGPKKSFLPAKIFGWEKVAKDTLEVFNKVGPFFEEKQ